MKFWLMAAFWLWTAAAQPPKENCTLEGQVLKAGSGEPLKKAVVVVRKLEGRESYSTTTDEGGKFVLTGLEPGRYRLSAERNGYVRQDYGQRRADQPGTVVTLQSGQRLTGLSFQLTPFAVITGRVMDEDGEPTPHVRLQAMRYSRAAGRRELIASASASSDDRGEYRIFGLQPGRYYVSAAPSAGRPDAQDEEGYVPFYYPGVADPSQAAPLDLRAGSEMHSVDFRLVRTRTVRVRGRVLNAVSGRPEKGILVFVLPRGPGGLVSVPRTQTGAVDAQGGFDIRGVPPGSYILTAFLADRDTRYFARQPIEVGSANLEGITLVLGPGMEIGGRIRVEGTDEFTLSGLRILLESRSGNVTGSSVGRPKPDGTFSISNVASDSYTVSILGLSGDYYVKAIRLGGADVLERGLDVSRGDAAGPLEVALSAAAGHIEGVVLEDNQQPSSGATVALVPDASRRSQPRLFQSAAADQQGRFSLGGVSPGEYKLFAWEDVDSGAWQDPDFLRDFESRGLSVSIDEGSHQTVQLKAIPAEDSAGKTSR